jgi:hypothetical protein
MQKALRVEVQLPILEGINAFIIKHNVMNFCDEIRQQKQ